MLDLTLTCSLRTRLQECNSKRNRLARQRAALGLKKRGDKERMAIEFNAANLTIFIFCRRM